MKKIFKVLSGVMLGVSAICLSSCQLDLDLLTKNTSETTSDTTKEDTDPIRTIPYPYSVNPGNENTTSEDNVPEEEDDEIVNEEDTELSDKYVEMKEKLDELNLDYKTLYGYQKLGEDSKNGEYMQKAYADLWNIAYNFLVSDDDAETTDFSSTQVAIIGKYKVASQTELALAVSAWMTMIEENPLFYFTYTGYKEEKNVVYFIGGDDYIEASARYDYNSKILSFVDEFKTSFNAANISEDNIDTSSTDTVEYLEAKFIHDYICSRVEYAYTYSSGTKTASDEYYAHNIIGVVTKKGVVCEGYAEAYTFLANILGLESLVVVGNVTSSGESYGHAWNYVKVDGTWYGVDTTWDDDTVVSYDYFMVSAYVMSKNGREPDTPIDKYGSSNYGIYYQVELPTLSSTSWDTSLDAGSQGIIYIPYPGLIPLRRLF